MNVVLFTGGNGNANLIKHIKDISYVNLSLLINGYDDGLSTGVIRRANYGMLGPSDFRKNFTYILDDFTIENRNLKGLFEHRLSDDESKNLLVSPKEIIPQLIQSTYFLEKNVAIFIEKYFDLGVSKLLEYTKKFEDLNGFSVGNIIIGGLFAQTHDFNKALEILTTQFELTAKLINVSTSDDSKLVAFDAEGQFLRNEADIVSYPGDKPLSDFYLLPLATLESLKDQIQYTKNEIQVLSVVPSMSEEAIHAIQGADLIIFGSGTQFSSLLPSYRICKSHLIHTKAKKIFIVNNDFDSDIRNITFEGLSSLVLKELDQVAIDYFDAILVDQHSKILPRSDHQQVTISAISDKNLKHDGQKLWNWINRSLDLKHGEIPVAIIFSKDMDDSIKNYYQHEISNLNKDDSRIIQFHLEEISKDHTSYHLFLDATGKVSLFDIEIWIQMMQLNQLDAVIGSRFDSRRQLIRSFKHTLVESNFTYFFALTTSYFVSLVYFIRFWKIIPDPLSGIYLVRSKYKAEYRSLPYFLKRINKMKGFELVSLPIGYRTFKKEKIITKIKNVVVNLANLYV